eukprot:jgi/Astpho2/5697/Aster-02935
MGLGDAIVRHHAKIAKVVLPASIAFGFMYTMQTGRSPLTDAKTAATGQEGMQYSIRVSHPSSSS